MKIITKITCVFITILILIMAVGCGTKSTVQDDSENKETIREKLEAQGEVSLTIKSNGRHAAIQGINAPTGTVSLMKEKNNYYLKFNDDFMISDEGNIFVYISIKKGIPSVDEIKEDSQMVSELINKEGEQEYRLEDGVLGPMINSVAFYDKDNNNVVAWAIFE